jgi:hypothetical protein
VLDFGLAKVGGLAGQPGEDLSNSPTFTLSGTQEGVTFTGREILPPAIDGVQPHGGRRRTP